MGAEIQNNSLFFNPKPNDRLDGLSLHMRFRKVPVEITLKEDSLAVATRTDVLDRSIKVSVGNESREIKDGERHAFTL